MAPDVLGLVYDDVFVETGEDVEAFATYIATSLYMASFSCLTGTRVMPPKGVKPCMNLQTWSADDIVEDLLFWVRLAAGNFDEQYERINDDINVLINALKTYLDCHSIGHKYSVLHALCHSMSIE